MCVLVCVTGASGTTGGVASLKTLTGAVAVLPLWVVAVIVALPALLAVTTPAVETVATAVLLLIHVTVLLVAPTGSTVAVSVLVPPTSRLILPVGLMLTLAAGTVAVEFVVALKLV